MGLIKSQTSEQFLRNRSHDTSVGFIVPNPPTGISSLIKSSFAGWFGRKWSPEGVALLGDVVVCM